MKNKFEGWYFKHQANGKSLAIIAGRAADGAFVQVITETQAYYISYPLSAYQREEKSLQVGDNLFSHKGITLDIQEENLVLQGEIIYGTLTPIAGDIMGPFRFFPMECRHGVQSMLHTLSGTCTLNGVAWDFTGGKGYMESDSGRSFPKGYSWIQCNDFENCSIMAAVAEIPFYGLDFRGTICVVWLNGKEYRLATYKGVKILRLEAGTIELKQGGYHLLISADTQAGHLLKAPIRGKMHHMIRENIACKAYFCFRENGKILFEGESKLASYEYEYDL